MKKAFIDCGHGGYDSGAVGVDNVYEKNITLSVGLKVKELLIPCGIEVSMSRASDLYVSLENRVLMANSWGANCFVSIHCNSSDNASANGIETFSYTTSTNDLAKCVHNSILEDKSLYQTNRGLKTANFYVIRYTQMRACLVEVSFISNRVDKDIVVNNEDKFALQIAKGICSYLGVAFVNKVEYGIGEYQRDVQVIADSLNVRNGRGVEYDKIGALSKGTVVNIWYIDKAKDGSLWGSFRFKNPSTNIDEIGFIAMDYVKPL